MKRKVDNKICYREPRLVRRGTKGIIRKKDLEPRTESIFAEITMGAPITAPEYQHYF
ncbi:MAG: hypothetical protein K0S41_3666 [Anaerocolumna sp.]|jgi:hypothetical protein|nr:hypothetical protein [Anaerocolumna sp.]